MKIGLYGGSFNPIHFGHLHVADTAARAFHLDKVIFIPTGDSYMKPDIEMAPSICRLIMTIYACATDKRFSVSTVDIDRKGPTYTIDTVKKMKELYPDDELYFIIGSDSLEQLPLWHGVLELMKEISFIVVNRKKTKVKIPDEIKNNKDFDANIINDAVKISISSTEIRDAIAKDMSCKYLMPPNVYEYILEHKLYQDWKTLERMTKDVRRKKTKG